MKKSFFTTFQLGSSKEPLRNLDDITNIIIRWLKKPKRGFSLPPSFSLTDNEFKIEANDHKLFKYYFTETKVGELLAIRYEHDDSSSDDVFWRTEIVIGKKIFNDDHSYRFSINIWYGSRNQKFQPIVRQHSRPNLIYELIQEIGAFELFPLQNGHIPLPQKDNPIYFYLLTSSRRKLPIIFISRDNNDNKPIVNVSSIIRNCSGMAYIIMSDEQSVTWDLQTYLGKTHNCYDGAVRIYWPGFKVTDNPQLHTLWTQEQILDYGNKDEFEYFLFNQLCEHAQTRYVSEYLTWEGAQKIDRQKRLEKAKETGTQEEWIQLLEEENLSLSSSNDEKTNEIKELKGQVFDLRKQNEQLLTSIKYNKSINTILNDTLSFDSFNSVISDISKKYRDHILIEKRAIKDSSFKDYESLHKALTWLALTYCKYKTKEVQIENLDHSCKESCGFFYSSNQSTRTMGQYKDDYEYFYNGEKHQLKEHIGTGANKHPEYTIRIAFFFDKESNKVIVGYLGQHQRTRAT
ncbi:hypothetical protein CYPRO_0691 [Cyclonatronum proteinivorum]|uniref:Uncharacterized protein n=1 Tax=Cyclonatronum proteinivorum TaxID=1457365 RepID=A0A345UHM3_9BACT|nr:hypothetical protein [Cyclonatronum proteinivorum]AXI99974.1 hypothetical protein CYPRO_0691 [Cyclonatronum proteinivorum]